jgi:hypothetical protein
MSRRSGGAASTSTGCSAGSAPSTSGGRACKRPCIQLEAFNWRRGVADETGRCGVLSRCALSPDEPCV